MPETKVQREARLAAVADGTAPQGDDRPPVRFITVDEFKEQLGVSKIEVLLNPKTDKIFMSAGGNSYKVQQDIDNSIDMKILIPEGEALSEACLVNVAGGAETQFSL